MTMLDRRALLKRSAAVTAGTLLAGTGTQALAAHAALAAPGKQRKAPDNGGYGPLRPVADKTTGEVLLHLPAGFTYASFGHGADFPASLGGPYTGSDGHVTPGRHDGMAAFATGDKHLVRLVRNHEQGYDPTEGEGGRAYDRTLIGDRDKAYDPRAAGGTTTMTFDTRTLTLVDSFISLGGTSVNCAGGPTPWGSWLTCEETVNGTQNGFTKDHGYVFEVPAAADGPVGDPQPYREMGRFAHEAVAIDPATGVVYETEDSGDTSGFYRFVPKVPGDLGKGGRLEMLAVKGRPNLETHPSSAAAVGQVLQVEWVTISDPDPASSAISTESVFNQGWAQGGASFARLEGAWYDSGSIFFNATSGGDRRAGQVWEYRPKRGGGGELVKLYESPSRAVLDAPDNITVSPRGGLVLCEDGGGEQYVRGLNVDGEIFDLALNAVPAFGGDEDFVGNEFAGACFSPDGDVMFVNIQTPGISFAIRGPWKRGAL